MRARLASLAERIVPANPGGVVYGILAIGALLAAESGEHESYLDTLASAAIAAALYWVAHAYAELLGQRLAERERLCASALARALAHDWAIMRGAALPLLAIVGVIATFTYRRTNSYVPGALISALFVTWYIVAGQAMQSPVWPGAL